MSDKKIAIIAGSGNLPKLIAKKLTSDNYEICVIAINNEADKEWVSNFQNLWISLGEVDKTINYLHKNSISSVVIAGAISRTSLASLKPDFTAVKLLAKAGISKLAGDDKLLKVVIDYLTQKGIRVLEVDEIISEITAEKGLVGNIACNIPNEELAKALEIAREIGKLDIGQSIIWQSGRVIAVEAAEGTDMLLQRSQELISHPDDASNKAILVKVKKPNQTRKADLPTIGLQTILNAKKAGVKGIVIEAENTIFLDKEECIKTADESDIFIISVA